MSQQKATTYYIPHNSRWPVLASLALGTLVVGLANLIQQSTGIWKNEGTLPGLPIFLLGFAGIVTVLSLWWRDTIRESLGLMNSQLMDRSYRMGMMWFIFSEVMFFAAFFGTLLYARVFSVPWLGGEGDKGVAHMLWPNFHAAWPLLTTPSGKTTEQMHAWGLPAINTLLLLTSSVTCTFAHHALLAGQRKKQIQWLGATLLLGFSFLVCQATEYHEAYTEMGLTLHAGIYGSTFFLLTGFHGLHVTLGATMLTVMFVRSIKGHLTPDNHFGFEAASWYWHFVDVVWVLLFIFVYWI